MPANPDLYPANWPEIAQAVKEEAYWKCERCGIRHQEDGTRGSVLTVHHRDHNPANCKRSNLVALCARCHLRADAKHHARNAARTRRRKRIEAGQIPLPIGD